MKVKELIEKLKEFPENMEVFKPGASVGGNFFFCEAWKPLLREQYVKDDDGRQYIAQRPCEETRGAIKCLIL